MKFKGCHPDAPIHLKALCPAAPFLGAPRTSPARLRR
jgi:hypothetical protein